MKQTRWLSHKNWVGAALAGIALTVMGMGPASAAYPERAVTLVVPYPAGGATDNWARRFAERLSDRLDQPVIVQNQPGASTQVGATAVSKAKPDGYTLLFTTGTHIQLPALYNHLAYKVPDDFTTVGRLGTTGLILVTHPSVPVKNMQEFISAAKAGKFSFASSGAGSPGEVYARYLAQSEQLDMVSVPYGGEAPAIVDVISGVAQAGAFSAFSATPHVLAGRLNPIGAISTDRSPLLPNVPTITEQGSKYDGAVFWAGVFGPAGMPAEAVDRLAREMQQIAADPQVQEAYVKMGLDLRAFQGPDDFNATIKQQMQDWAKLVKELDIRPQ